MGHGRAASEATPRDLALAAELQTDLRINEQKRLHHPLDSPRTSLVDLADDAKKANLGDGAPKEGDKEGGGIPQEPAVSTTEIAIKATIALIQQIAIAVVIFKLGKEENVFGPLSCVICCCCCPAGCLAFKFKFDAPPAVGDAVKVKEADDTDAAQVAQTDGAGEGEAAPTDGTA